MRVLLTGAGGFVGRHLLPLLEKHDVLRLKHSRDERVSEHAREVLGDLTADGPWQTVVREFEPEWCIHLAWEGLPDYSLKQCRRNCDASLRLIDTVVAAGVKRFVAAGSCWEYGRRSGSVSETMEAVDPGVFAATKHAIRTVLDSAARERGFDYRWARIFFVYGPGQRDIALVPHLRSSYAAGSTPALREPQAVQDFVHVNDVVRGLLALAESDGPSGIFNLGSGRPTSVGNIANLVADHYGQSRSFSDVDNHSGFWANPEKTAGACGWTARIGVEEGVRRTLRALDENRE